MLKFNSFFYGIIAALSALFFELAIRSFYPLEHPSDFFSNITPLLALAVLAEEILKFIFLFRLRKQVPLEIFYPYSLIFGSGFAFAEIIFFHTDEIFYFNYFPQIIGIIIIHMTTCGIMGFFMEKSTKLPKQLALAAIFSTSLIHLGYNAIIIKEASKIFSISYLSGLILISLLLHFHKKRFSLF